jgi:hypothetical protein
MSIVSILTCQDKVSPERHNTTQYVTMHQFHLLPQDRNPASLDEIRIPVNPITDQHGTCVVSRWADAIRHKYVTTDSSFVLVLTGDDSHLLSRLNPA